MDMVKQDQILNEPIWILHCSNPFQKGKNPVFPPAAMGKIMELFRNFLLGIANSVGERKLWIQTW